MSNIKIRVADTDDIPLIVDLAQKTWFHTYSSILEKDQVDFMFGEIYTPESLFKQMTFLEHKFLLLFEDEIAVAFASFSKLLNTPHIHKLNKIYILPNQQGKGFGAILLKEVEQRVINDGNQILRLNVNKYNKAKTFYEKNGFIVIAEEDIPIGKYFMNDYLMEKILATVTRRHGEHGKI